MNHKAKSIRPFIGCRDFEISRSFYRALGCVETELDPKMSLFEMGGLGFYLQNYYTKDWIDNTMVFLEVDDADRYHAELMKLDLPGKFPGARLVATRTMPWGKECFLHDPAGVLWHFGEFNSN